MPPCVVTIRIRSHSKALSAVALIPTVDHTTQTGAGQYVYIESSYPQGYGDKAWLVSEVLESPRGACLEFWYHMKGNTTGNLSVHHRILDRPPTSLWFMGGDGFESDIALDDVQFTQGDTCAYLASTTPSPVTPPSTLFECDFEDGTTCEWQDETSTKPWRVSSGETAIFGQAPLTDHTKQNVKGKYAVVPVESTGGPLYYSTIGFRDLPRGLSICLDFWYQVFVSSDTTLNVYLQNGTSATVMIWQRPGTTARDQWTHATVNLGVILASMDLTMSADFVWERNSGATSSAGTGPSNAGNQGDLWRPARVSMLAAAKFQVPVHSNKIFAHGRHRRTRVISIGIVYHQNKSVYSTMERIIRKSIRQLAHNSDIFSGQHPIFERTIKIKHHDSTRKFFSLIKIKSVPV
ncbi:unnamed protein product [Sphagnum troendelagicum]